MRLALYAALVAAFGWVEWRLASAGDWGVVGALWALAYFAGWGVVAWADERDI